jgi:hypothetical protein
MFLSCKRIWCNTDELILFEERFKEQKRMPHVSGPSVSLSTLVCDPGLGPKATDLPSLICK